MSNLFQKATQGILNATKAPQKDYTADQLTYIVKQFPMPSDALKMLKLSPDNVPILYLDVDFMEVGRLLIHVLETRQPLWPIFMLREGDNIKDEDKMPLEAFLHSNGMGVMIIEQSDVFWCRSEVVRLCDIRVSFNRGL